ncbi:hypothetical protein [Microbacterium sp. Se5.02b]
MDAHVLDDAGRGVERRGARLRGARNGGEHVGGRELAPPQIDRAHFSLS